MPFKMTTFLKIMQLNNPGILLCHERMIKRRAMLKGPVEIRNIYFYPSQLVFKEKVFHQIQNWWRNSQVEVHIFFYKQLGCLALSLRFWPNFLAISRIICLGIYLSVPNENLNHGKQFKAVFKKGGGQRLVILLIKVKQLPG